MHQKGHEVPPYVIFLLFNLFFFMMDTTDSYFSIYLNECGVSKAMVGVITGTAGLCALAFQPVFGMMADGAKSKSRMLQLMILCTATLYPLILLNQSIAYIFVIFVLYTIVRRFQSSLNTSMSVEFAEQSHKAYGPIRMMGALGYSLIMVVVGRVAGLNTRYTFVLYSCICLVNILLLFPMPAMPGHNRRNKGERVSMGAIIKNRPVLTLMLYQVLMSVANGLAQTFFGIYFTDDMGGSNALYGTMLSIGAMVEIPFLFFSDRFLRLLGARKLLLILGLLTATRWFGAYLAGSTSVLFAVQMGNCINMLYSVVIALMLSRLIAPQLKTTVQALAVAVQSVISIVISSYLGGLMANLFGIRPLFLMAGIIAGVTAIVFCLFIFKDYDRVPGEDAA